MYKNELKPHTKHQYQITCFGPMEYQRQRFWLKVKWGNCTFVSVKLCAYYAHCIDAIKTDRFMGDYQDYYDSMAYDSEYAGDFEDYYESLENDLQYGDGDY